MKRILYTLLLLGVVIVAGCRKDVEDIDIKEYDQAQIQAYINANGLSSMQRDKTDGDTTGIYYQILDQGHGAAVDYPDRVFYVFTLKTLDGLAVYADTISASNRNYNFLGYSSPKGLQLGIKNLLKNKGGKIRMLIPSRLAYGTNGSGTGATRIRGNQSLDCTVTLVDDQDAYDQISIQKYMAANNLTGYTKTASGLWYKIEQVGTGALHPTLTSTVEIQYTGKLFNGVIFQQANNNEGTGVSFVVNDYPLKGLHEGLPLVTAGAKLSLIIPSKLAFGTTSDSVVGSNSCVFYGINLLKVTDQ